MRKTSTFRSAPITRWFTCFAILLSSTLGYSQYAGYMPVKDIEGFKMNFAVQSKKVLTIASEFQQEKHLIALTEKIRSTGKFWFKRSNKVRINYEKPFVYQLIMNGDRVMMKDEQKQNQVNLKSNKLFQQINRVMLDCVQGTILESKDFTTRVFENEQRALLELKPVGKGLKDFFSDIVLVVDKKNYSVSEIRMNEPGGDQTIMTFSNKLLNQPINEDVFTF